jgi:1,2-diacylglycerol 3-alpha-glucosyltransferase
MRIGIFTDTYLPYVSGVVTSELMLKRSLESMGHTVYVVTANLETFHYEYDEKEKVLKIPGVPIGIYDARLTGIYPVSAIKTIKSWNLDVIHSQTEFGIGTFSRIISKQFDIPIVHTYHTMYEDYVYYITKGYFEKTGKKIVKYLTKFYCDKTVTDLIVPTAKTYELVKDKYKIESDIHIIPTGIEVEDFYCENFSKLELSKYRKKLKLSKNDFILITVSRIAKEKSIDKLLINHKKLIDKGLKIKFLIVGDGPDLEELKKLAIDLKIDKYVIFTGKVPLDEVKYYYQLGNIFVTASTSETQGLTVVEAISSSLPVVAINDFSFKTSVIDGLNGYLFNTDEEYINSIENLYNDKKLYLKFSNQARINSETFSSKYFGQRVLEVYKSAISKCNKEKNNITYKIKNVFKKVRDKICQK